MSTELVNHDEPFTDGRDDLECAVSSLTLADVASLSDSLAGTDDRASTDYDDYATEAPGGYLSNLF